MTLVNQDGEAVRFYSDVVKGKIVAINTIFTTCTTICPLMGANFARLQGMLPAEARQRVRLISISVDPITDSPARLKAWADGFGRAEGWTLLSGAVRDVETVLKDLGIFSADKWDHSPVVIVGREGTDRWIRANGLASATEVHGLISQLLESEG